MIAAEWPMAQAILTAMREQRGTNWTPLAVAEYLDANRGTVKNAMNELEKERSLERVSRGLYRIPIEDNDQP